MVGILFIVGIILICAGSITKHIIDDLDIRKLKDKLEREERRNDYLLNEIRAADRLIERFVPKKYLRYNQASYLLGPGSESINDKETLKAVEAEDEEKKRLKQLEKDIKKINKKR